MPTKHKLIRVCEDEECKKEISTVTTTLDSDPKNHDEVSKDTYTNGLCKDCSEEAEENEGEQ